MASMIWKPLSPTSLAFEALFVFEGQAEFHQENKNTAAPTHSFQIVVTQRSLCLFQWPFILWTRTTLPKKCFNASVLSDRVLKHTGWRCLLSFFQPSGHPSLLEDCLLSTDRGSTAWENTTQPWTYGEGRTSVSIYYAWTHLSDGIQTSITFLLWQIDCRQLVDVVSSERGNAMRWHLNLEIASLDLPKSISQTMSVDFIYFIFFLEKKCAGGDWMVPLVLAWLKATVINPERIV